MTPDPRPAPSGRRVGDAHAPLAPHPLAEAAVEAYLAGVAACDPAVLVKRAVRQGLVDDWLGDRERPRRIQVLALGKAAPRMLWGLVEGGVPFAGLGVAPKGVPAPGVDTFRWLPGDHPVPGSASLAAGREVSAWARRLPEGEPVLALLSGGASACAEEPAPGVVAADLAARWRELLRSGMPVEEMNRERARLSSLKAGGLGRILLGRTPQVRAWVLADTDPAEASAAVGSGPLHLAEAHERIPHRVLASSDDLVVGAGLRLGSLGWSVYRHPGRIRGRAEAEVDAFLDGLAGLPRGCALVGGGEATVAHPADAPPGGRAQHAALLAARRLAADGSDAVFLACASDGVDGSTGAAGAWTLAADWTPEAHAALDGFDAHGHLAARGRLVTPGPTGTNVNDLWVAIRP